jgi:AcrR family transcriptional regulator
MAATSAQAPSEKGAHGIILQAVHECFVRYGPEKTSIQDVASVAGVSRGTVYRYFKDRDDLVAAYVDWAGDQFLELARARIDRLPAFEAQVAELAVLARSPQTVLGAQFSIVKLPAETMTLILTVHSAPTLRKTVAFLAPYVREAKKRKELRSNLDVDEAAEWIAHILLGMFDMPCLTFDAEKPDELRRFVRRYVVRGLA